jgi:hypothetical protein
MLRMSLTLTKMVCFLVVLLVVTACQPTEVSKPPAITPTGSPLPATPASTPLTAPTQAPAAVASTPGVLEMEWAFGPGPLKFWNATAGLSKLSSYQSTLNIAFRGTRAGQPQEWSTSYVMLAAQKLAGRQLTFTNTGEGLEPAKVYKAEMGGVAYERLGNKACTAVVLDQKKSLAALWEPASFLAGVTGGEKVGSETVNGLVTDRYTFDERAFGPFPPSQSTGQMWVASNGGFIVRYFVTTVAKADYFGEGIEGTITWDYQLSNVNQPVVIELPKDCPAGIIDAPHLPDAGNLQNVPGLVSYTTASSLAKATAFYQQELPALGWQPIGNPVVGEILAVQDFTRADQQLAVIVTKGEGGTTVKLMLGPIQP